ncbi:unnamed protein product [Brassicogethes aeneus]|uniref:Beta-catenin-like protein 1 N-terminal domain-containing protein n=1 Tax=Brassicogethes aeneus TaxID=1431903 RepID=A0A9P0B4V0_BRAAE|nr:unnamed protein product [Brassicogethes aeneus]
MKPTDVSKSDLEKVVLNFNKICIQYLEAKTIKPNRNHMLVKNEQKLLESLKTLRRKLIPKPEYYDLVSCLTIQNLSSLISNNSIKIVLIIVDVLKKISTMDVLEDFVFEIVEMLLEEDIILKLIAVSNRLNIDDKEESKAVYDIFTIIGSFAQLGSEIVDETTIHRFMTFLLTNLNMKKYYSRKTLYASEFLNILLQDSERNRYMFRKINGMVSLLKQMEYYKKFVPETSQEEELMNHMFSSLCSCLVSGPLRCSFLKLNGVELMISLLEKEKIFGVVLKVLTYAFYGPNGEDSCNRFVDKEGLKNIFPSKKIECAEYEKQLTSIAVSLLRNCGGKEKGKILEVFKADGYREIKNLLELHSKYFTRVNLAEQKYHECSYNEAFFMGIECGLNTLQFVDYILVNSSLMDDKIKQLVKLFFQDKDELNLILLDYAQNLPDDGLKEWKYQERQKIEVMLKRFKQTSFNNKR